MKQYSLFFIILGLIWSQSATAKTAVIAVPYAQGVDAKQRIRLARLIAAEVEYMDTFEEVNELSQQQAQVTERCLRSGTCIFSIAKKHKAQAIVTGKVVKRGKNLSFLLVYCERNKFIRKHSFVLPNNATALADNFGKHITKLLTGKEPVSKTAAAAPSLSSSDEEEEEEDGLQDFVPTAAVATGTVAQRRAARKKAAKAAAAKQARLEARQRAAAAAAAKAEAEKQARLEARQRAAAAAAAAKANAEAEKQARLEARQRAAAAAAAKAEAEKRARLQARQQAAKRNNDLDLDDESLDGSEDSYELNLGASKPKKSNDLNLDDDPDDLDLDSNSNNDLDLDEEPAPRKKAKAKRKKAKKKRRSLDTNDSRARTKRRSSQSDTKAALAGRLGASKFQDFSFLTYGAEFSYFAVDNIAVIFGMEAYATKRIIPAEFVPEGMSNVEWNVIIPINLGALYHFDNGKITPNVGGDIVMIPGYVRETGGTAFGMRLRGGCNFAVSDSVGLSLNTSLGFWSGEDFNQLQSTMSSLGFVPQLSLGTTFSF